MYNNNKSVSDKKYESGAEGESKTAYILRRLPSGCVVYNNLILDMTRRNSKGVAISQSWTVQIDHLVIAPFGVYCIETKNHSGRVVGDEYDDVWCHILDNGKATEFYSPCMQNNKHLKHLQMILGVSPVILKALLVFTNDKVDLRAVHCHYVRVENLISYFNREAKKRRKMLGFDDILHIKSIIDSRRLVGKEAEERHKAYAREQNNKWKKSRGIE